MSCDELTDRHFAFLALAVARFRRARSVTMLHTEIECVARVLKFENRRSVVEHERAEGRTVEPCPSCGALVCDPRVLGTSPRYLAHDRTARPCPFALVEIPRAAAFHIEGADAFAAVRVIKAAQCYQYNACESPDWIGSMARTITDDLITRAISDLPGYDAAPWGIQ